MIQKNERTTTNPPALYYGDGEEKKDDKRQERLVERQNLTIFIEMILFPEDESSPQMVKVKFDTRKDKGK